MDKKFVMSIAAMAALTLVSCSSDDLNSISDNSSKDEAISFDGYWGRSAVAVNGSRGSVLDVTALQNSTEGFGVFGHYKEANGKEFGSDLFNNQQVTYKASAWTYSPLKFWPTQGHIDFLAYAPYDSKYVNKVTTDNQKIDFTVNSTIKDQKDLLWANNAVNQTKDNISGTGNKVKFQFKHALSRLGYSVKLYKDFTSNNVEFRLKEITLAGSDPKSTTASTTESAKAFYTNGTIDLSTGIWEKHSAGAGKQDFINWFSGPQDVTSATESKPYKNPTSDYLFIIPQNFSENIGTTESPVANPDKLYVIVEYDIHYKDINKTIPNKVYKQLTPNFLQGKAYMLNLTIGLPIEFDVDVTEGVEGWGTDENINIGSNDTPWER